MTTVEEDALRADLDATLTELELCTAELKRVTDACAAITRQFELERRRRIRLTRLVLILDLTAVVLIAFLLVRDW